MLVDSSLFDMATINNATQRPKFPTSQSFRTQVTETALAGDAPLARAITEKQGLSLPKDATKASNGTNGSEATPSQSQPLGTGILHHRLNATGSVQAIVIDDDVLFAGLQGGDIVVCIGAEQTKWTC